MANFEQENQELPVNEWTRFAMRIGVTSVLHPFDYAKVLIQIGYEPVAPVPGRTMFGYPTLILPNIFKYAAYIKNADGWMGCFRGLSPKLVGNLVSTHLSEDVADRLGLAVVKEEVKDEELTAEELYEKFKKDIKRNVVVHAAGVLISQPFHVISIRMMAQFVGKEKMYNGICSSIAEIYRQNGISGFFSGFIPRLICDLGGLVFASTATYLVSQYLIKERDSRMYFASISQFVASSILYPLHVVATCVIVSGSGLEAGRPPRMNLPSSWIEVYRHLKLTGNHKRGSSLFWRYIPLHGRRDISYTEAVPMPRLEKYK